MKLWNSQLVGHAGAHVAQLALGDRLVARAQARFDGLAQVDLAHVGARAAGAAVAEILHVEHAQRRVFERERLARARVRELRGAADRALHLELPRARHHGPRAQAHVRAAVVEAGLVDLDAFVAGRMVHLHARGRGLARGLVVDHDLAGEQLGHAGGVVLHDEFLELHRERQLLQQHAVGLAQDGRGRLRALGHHQVAAEGGVALGQAVLGLDLGDQPAARVGRLAAEPHLRAHDQVAVEQSAQADEHDGAVRGDVADLVGRTRLGRHHPACAGGRLTLLQAHLPAHGGQHLPDAARGGLGCLARQVGLRLVVEGLQALFSDVFLVVADVRQVFGRVPRDAQRRAHHQERQDQQEPPRAVDRVELERQEQLGPERPELVHVVGGGLVLLEHSADHRGDADHREQRDREAHGRQQLGQRPRGVRAPGAAAGRKIRHGRRQSPKEKRAGHPFRCARPSWV
jgi:hypothetical protein